MTNRALTETERCLANAESALNRADDIRNRDRWHAGAPWARAVDSAYHVAVASTCATMALAAAQVELTQAMQAMTEAIASSGGPSVADVYRGAGPVQP